MRPLHPGMLRALLLGGLFALAAGCTCVIKPSELTSGTALEVAALAAKVPKVPI